MNKKRRASISEALFLLKNALSIIRIISMEEDNALNNIPENLQDSEIYAKSESAIENLESAEEYIQDAISELDEIS